jgi:hypothetical protein
MYGARVVVGLLLAVSLMACGTTVPAGQTPSPTLAELGAGPPVGSAEAGGIAVEIWLDRTKVLVGDTAMALVRVSNIGTHIVQRETNTCGTGPARTRVVQRDAEGQAAVPVGETWPRLAGEFKRQVLADAGLGEERDLGVFWDAKLLGTNILCTLASRIGPFNPGDSEFLVLAWRAVAPEGSVIVPGPAIVRATFGTAGFGQPGAAPTVTVTAEAPIEIVTPDSSDQPAGLTLVDYVDAALSDASFMEWLESAPQDTWSNTLVSYWPTEEGSYPEMPPFNALGRRPVVEIGLARMNPLEDLRLVIVDRETAKVWGVRSQ